MERSRRSTTPARGDIAGEGTRRIRDTHRAPATRARSGYAHATMSNPSMTRAEREAFLAQTHVAILSVEEPGRGPCATPVWYRYEPGGPIRITLSPTSRKASLLRKAGRASLCAQTESLPYRYVTVEGAIELRETDVSGDRHEIAHRYLGAARA